MKKFISEFKEFAVKGNMLDLAIGVIIGGAFNTIVKSLVDDCFMPAVGMLLGGHDFSKLSLKIGEATITYGNLIQNIVNFLITAFCLFIFVKGINSLKRKKEVEEAEEATAEEESKKAEDIVLLEEIRDALKELSNK
ncbi:MAG: large-conductance mechanosensitive channel protein MscL [Ruminococcaceae bacterium]|nr:large-conductance mechanosensitive channel protein MscL [Oscillospiraceae bacterium]